MHGGTKYEKYIGKATTQPKNIASKNSGGETLRGRLFYQETEFRFSARMQLTVMKRKSID